jgi:hypothetical protein
MRARLLVLLAAAACSKDWSLAQQPSGADGASPRASATALCDQIPALARAPKIDGQLEPGLALYGWLDTGSPGAPPGLAMSLSLAYAPGGLISSRTSWRRRAILRPRACSATVATASSCSSTTMG